MERVDRKFSISAVCREHGHHFTEADAILFVAKDKALPATLKFYLEECQRLGADDRQLAGVRLLLGRVEAWQAESFHKVKVADIDVSEIGEAIIAPNEAGTSDGR